MSVGVSRTSVKHIPKMRTDRSQTELRHPGIGPNLLGSTYRAAVEPYLPVSLVDALAGDPGKKPQWIVSQEGSLLFADVSGFTRMSEGLARIGKEGAEILTGIINRYFGAMLDIARSHGGDNLKFGGDALLILFLGEGHATRAVASGLAMLKATKGFPAARVGPDRIRLGMSAGVHSGNFWFASAGVPGNRMQHFVLGREVNRVAAVEGTAPTGELYVTRRTAEQAASACLIERRGNDFRAVRLTTRDSLSAFVKRDSRMPDDCIDKVLPYVPPHIVHELQTSGHATGLEGEHRRVAVMFINLLGVDELLEERPPEALLDELQRYVSLLIRLADQYGGFLVSNDIYTNGVKLILAFGAPIAHEHDAANAFRLALHLDQELLRQGGPLRHRIGINSGYVFSGDVGPSYRREYTVMGDDVNLAARLMSAASPGEILVSQQTREEAGPRFEVEEISPISVKGKEEPIQVGLLEAEHHVSVIGATERTGTLLGRETEVDLLHGLCAEVESGNGRTIVISGETGIGKSRLVLEYQDYLHDRGWTIYRGECQSHRAAMPFGPWVDILEAFFGITSEETTSTRTEKVLATIQLLRPDLVEVASLLNALLTLSIPQTEVVRSLDAETRRTRLFDMVADLLRATAEAFPLALVLEDLHWADRSSLQLIDYITTRIGPSNLLVCLTHRPKEGLLSKAKPASTIAIVLNELPDNVALQIVRTALDRPQLPQQLEEVILSKGKGNPLFLEELARSLRQSGVLDRLLEAPSFRISSDVAALDIPDRVQALVMSRIDGLGNTTKEALRIASVIGDTFDIPTLRHLIGDERETITLEVRLRDLVELEFVHRQGGRRGVSYEFRNALIREVAYESLLFAKRRALHHRIGSYLEDMHSEHLESFYELLLHHYEQSRDHPKSLLYSVRSGEKAGQVFAHEESIAYYQQSLAALKDMGGHTAHARSYLVERIGDCFEMAGRHAEAAETFSRALRVWRNVARRATVPPPMPLDIGDGNPIKVRTAVLGHKIGVSHERNSDYDSSLRWLKSAGRALPTRYPLQAAQIAVAESVALFRKGLYEEAINRGRRGLRLARRVGDHGLIAYAHNMLGSSYVESGKLRQASQHRKVAVRLYEEVGDLAQQATANNNLGTCYQLLGDLDHALQHYDVCLKACERIGNPVRIAITHNNVGEVLLVQGRLDEATSHFHQVVDTYERGGDRLAVAGLAFVNLSRACQYQKQYDRASGSLHDGFRLLREVGARGLLMEAYLQQADLALETGDVETALRVCQRVLREAREMGMQMLEARGLRVMGCVDGVRHRPVQAEANLQQSISLAKSNNADYERGLALSCLADLYARNPGTEGFRRKLGPALRQAITVFQRLGAERDLSKVLHIQGDSRRQGRK